MKKLIIIPVLLICLTGASVKKTQQDVKPLILKHYEPDRSEKVHKLDSLIKLL